jgi:hypothetical protein
MEPGKLRMIENKHIEAISNATNPGLKKRLNLQLKWPKDPNESLGE